MAVFRCELLSSDLGKQQLQPLGLGSSSHSDLKALIENKTSHLMNENPAESLFNLFAYTS